MQYIIIIAAVTLGFMAGRVSAKEKWIDGYVEGASSTYLKLGEAERALIDEGRTKDEM